MLQLKDGDAVPAATGPEKQISVSVWMAVPSGAGPQRWGTLDLHIRTYSLTPPLASPADLYFGPVQIL